jgi:hypothetical protein
VNEEQPERLPEKGEVEGEVLSRPAFLHEPREIGEPLQTVSEREREIDKRNRLTEEVFDYRTSKDGRVFITWHGRQVKILKGRAAQKFLADITDLDGRDAQLIMARITGNFKHGNER